jgi:hypothetical protein
VQIVNVFHVRNGPSTAGYTLAGISSLATAMANAFTTHLRPRLSVSWSGDDVVAQDLSSPTAPGVILSLSGNGSTSGVLPASVACCLTWKIARHYRGGHPRTYLGPLGSAALETATSFEAVFLTATQTAASSFLTAVNALTIEGNAQALVCLHRTLGGAQLATPTHSPILAVQVDSRLDTQRRRLGRDR